MLTTERQIKDTTPILGPVCARHHTHLRILGEQICVTLNALDAAICARDGARWTAAQRCLGELMMKLPNALDLVAETVDLAGEQKAA